MYKDHARMVLVLEKGGIKPVDDLNYRGQAVYTQEMLVRAVQLALESTERLGGADIEVDGFSVPACELPQGYLGSIVRSMTLQKSDAN